MLSKEENICCFALLAVGVDYADAWGRTVQERCLMIYLDNAATTMVKPPQVIEAVTSAMNSFGGVGRGVHGASISAGMAVFEAREQIAKLFNAPDASRVCFCANATQALNTAIFGMANPGDHIVTTYASHNSVLRPLYHLNEIYGNGIAAVKIASDGSLDLGAFERAFESPTKLVVITHASNLTGDIYDVAALAEVAHAYGARVVVDVAQTAGVESIDMQQMGADVLCFTGHKGLMGPQGTGGIVLAQDVEIRPLMVGGTGSHSFDMEHPQSYPDHLEAGTLNSHGIAGLAAGVSFVLEQGVDTIAKHDRMLAQRFCDGLECIPSAKHYGGAIAARTGIVAMNIGSLDSALVADALANDYGICTRAGAHCAPLMHKALGTCDQGAVRFSFGWYNTQEDVDAALNALAHIAAANR